MRYAADENQDEQNIQNLELATEQVIKVMLMTTNDRY